MRIPERRGIREDEVAVIRAALERALVRAVDEAASAGVAKLEVVGRCECGCASVDFDSPTGDQRSTLIADGTGTTPSGGQVGVIVWGRPDVITGLEIYDLGAGDNDLVLPAPTSVIPWERGRAG
jgi:hypothetical protein